MNTLYPSSYCTPPKDDCDEAYLTACDGLWIAADLARMEQQLADLRGQLDGSEVAGISNILAGFGDYLKMMNTGVMATDMNATHAASSALQSMELFNNNYKLLRDAFSNLLNFLKNIGLNTDMTYTIKDINQNYTLNESDMGGNVIFRITAPIEFTIAGNPGRGKIVHIRNATQQMIQLKVAPGSTVTPVDGLYLRREGSTAGLIYLGNNLWDLYGELP